MSVNSAIEWTESTWNPVTGCTKVSAGCAHCYAERMARRLKAMGVPNYRHGFRVAVHPDTLEVPLSWKKPQMIFVNSMGDLFHGDIPTTFVQKAFDVMRRGHWHQYQVLTKRAERLADLSPMLDWASNIWMGVTVENADCVGRIDWLRRTGAAVKFLSLEPLLGPLPNLDLSDIDWVVVGGESGPGARPIEPAWVTDIRDQCLKANAPFFFKQWGGVRKKRTGRLLEGRTWDQMPLVMAV